MSAETVLHDPLPMAHYVAHVYQAKCSCGWTSTRYPAAEPAADALAFHREHVGPA